MYWSTLSNQISHLIRNQINFWNKSMINQVRSEIPLFAPSLLIILLIQLSVSLSWILVFKLSAKIIPSVNSNSNDSFLNWTHNKARLPYNIMFILICCYLLLVITHENHHPTFILIRIVDSQKAHWKGNHLNSSLSIVNSWTMKRLIYWFLCDIDTVK